MLKGVESDECPPMEVCLYACTKYASMVSLIFDSELQPPFCELKHFNTTTYFFLLLVLLPHQSHSNEKLKCGDTVILCNQVVVEIKPFVSRIGGRIQYDD